MKKLKSISAILLCLVLTGCSIPNTNVAENEQITSEIESTIEDNVTELTTIEQEEVQYSESDAVLASNNDLKIYILDVGQGSSCLIKSNDSYMLIDAGENSCEDLIVQYLNDFGVTHLDYLIGTHPDSDHVGGLDAVIDNFDIDTVFLSAITDKDTKTCQDVLDSLESKGLDYSMPDIGVAYPLGGAYFFALAPSKHYDDANNNSIAIKLTYGDFDFVTTGDCEKEAESDICSLKYNISADVYNAGHHGSSNASSEEFLDRINPSVVTISCGADNKYGHPHDETMKRFADRNIRTYRTDELGTIEITSNGSIYSVNGMTTETEKENMVETTESYTEYESVEETTINNETVESEVPNYTVWITKTGSKYHREDCDSLSNSSIAITLQEALEKGLEPCKKCNP